MFMCVSSTCFLAVSSGSAVIAFLRCEADADMSLNI